MSSSVFTAQGKSFSGVKIRFVTAAHKLAFAASLFIASPISSHGLLQNGEVAKK